MASWQPRQANCVTAVLVTIVLPQCITDSEVSMEAAVNHGQKLGVLLFKVINWLRSSQGHHQRSRVHIYYFGFLKGYKLNINKINEELKSYE